MNGRYIPRLLLFYRETIVPQMKDKIGYANELQVPRLKKIVINMGLGDAGGDTKIVEKVVDDLALIAGQRPKITKARKPISNFKIRKGMSVGCCAVLRRNLMYEFLDRLISVALPRIRDFRGFPLRSFDGSGNYTFGLTEQNIFPELNLDKIERTQGMDITINTSAKTDQEAKELLILFGFPFRR
ncbi:MAG: 50S ribosomal protein L5 [Candidatus Omnitrophota bacterium]